MQVLLLVLVCGAAQCHYEVAGTFSDFFECYRAVGYEASAPMKRIPDFKCEQVTTRTKDGRQF